MDPKSLFRSKTFWFNVGLGLLQLAQSTGLLQALPDSVLATLGTIGNVALRIATKQPVFIK